MWDPLTGSLLSTLQGHSKVRFWRTAVQQAGTEAAVQSMHVLQGVSDVAWHPTGKYLASASDDKTLKLWASNSGECLRTLAGHTSYVFCCAFSPKGNIVASGSFDETLRLWNVTTGHCIKVRQAVQLPLL